MVISGTLQLILIFPPRALVTHHRLCWLTWGPLHMAWTCCSFLTSALLELEKNSCLLYAGSFLNDGYPSQVGKKKQEQNELRSFLLQRRIASIFGSLPRHWSPGWVQSWAQTSTPSAWGQNRHYPDGKQQPLCVLATTAGLTQSPTIACTFLDRASGHLLGPSNHIFHPHHPACFSYYFWP